MATLLNTTFSGTIRVNFVTNYTKLIINFDFMKYSAFFITIFLRRSNLYKSYITKLKY